MITGRRYFLQCFCLLAFVSGCADLPVRLPLPESESFLHRESFKEMGAKQRHCVDSVDADITVALVSKFYSGSISGYLQAKAPSSLKLVGVNPFGQPMVALVSDGSLFNYALFNEKLSYDGKVDSGTFRRFAPAGFDPASSFYTLTGKLPPGEVLILATSKDRDGHGTWMETEGIKDNIRRLVLFDPDRMLLLRYLQFNREGEVVLQVIYGEYSQGDCGLPGLITITSRDHSGELLLRLKDWRTDTPFSAADFALELPPDFKRVNVN